MVVDKEINFLFHLDSFGEYISGGDVVEKISKSYYCDYCGERCAHTEFILPEKGEDNVEWAKDRFGNKIMPFHYPNILSKQVDICPSCQNTIARIVNLMRYVNINTDKIEEDVYISLKNASTKNRKGE